jgi:hypothetical protein
MLPVSRILWVIIAAICYQEESARILSKFSKLIIIITPSKLKIDSHLSSWLLENDALYASAEFITNPRRYKTFYVFIFLLFYFFPGDK